MAARRMVRPKLPHEPRIDPLQVPVHPLRQVPLFATAEQGIEVVGLVLESLPPAVDFCQNPLPAIGRRMVLRVDKQPGRHGIHPAGTWAVPIEPSILRGRRTTTEYF